MTHLKKSLAMLLALIMMFSSMSVAATAWTVDDEPNDITFTVKFFRESPKGSGNWIETEKAAPGESLKLRVYIKTGFYTTGGETALVFDKAFFGLVGFENDTNKTLTVNDSYAGPDGDYYEAGEYELEASGGWKDADNFYEWGEKYDMDYILNEIEKDPKYFDKYDFLTSNIQYGNGKVNCMLVDDTWLYEYDLVVNNNAATTTVGSTGEARVPKYYNSLERDGEFPIDIMKGMEGAELLDRKNNKNMFLWVPEFYTNPDTISTTSSIVYDMGLVDDNGNWYEDTYTTELGIISKEADFTAIKNPEHPDGKLVFSHWSTTKPGKGVTQDEASVVTYDYDAKTLYAVWKAPSDVNYTLKEFYMNADGTYPEDVEGVIENATPDSTVSAPESTDPLFVLDAEKSSKDVVINKDGSSVVNAYYERVKYNLVYHYEDNTGSVTDDYKVRFGDKLPALGANSTGEPQKTGYEFLGWTTVEGGTEPETLPTAMPTNDLHLYAIYEPIKVYYLFDAVEGTFANGDQYMRYEYAYGEKTEAPETPAAPGKEFVEWDNDIPANAYEDLTFEAIYEDEIYTVTFKADTDEDGTYETIVAEKEFVYGEKLYPEFAPENYPLDAWKLEDGTAVEISDEETAYTVTDSVVLYTVGKDEYPARFYWSEEDLENGAEPYKTVYVKFDDTITAPEEDPEKPGYNFIIWTPDAESGLIMDSTDGKDFVAVFEAKEITVTYNPNGGECADEDGKDSAEYGKTVILPEATRDGYEFLGWVNPDEENVGKAGDEYAVPTEDVILKADWDAEEHTITFVDEDGKQLGEIVADTDTEIKTPENLNPPVKEGYTFTGWVDGNDKPADVPAKMPADDMTLTATWEKNSYALNVDANGGAFENGDKTIETEIPYGDKLAVEEPKWTGHTFTGWAEADDESNKIITLPETMPDEAINIKAVWDTNVHDVTYDAMGGIFTEEAVPRSTVVFENVEYGAEVPVPSTNPSKDGYTFIKWNPEKPAAMPDNDLLFTAEWEKNYVPTEKAYNIYISYPNPANPDETIKELVITDSALPNTTVEVIKAGEDKTADKAHTYEEILAKVDTNGIEPDYDNRPEAITVTENGGEIVVEFKLTEYIVEFNPNGGNFGDSEESVIVKGTWGQAVEAPAAPTQTGYNFTGWDKDVPATFTEDVVINATWEIQKHNAIFVVVDEKGEEVARIPVEYEYDETIVAPDYTAPEGYEFNGWDIPAGTKMGEEDIPFTSTLVPVEYTISYEISGLPADKGVTAPLAQKNLRAGKEYSVAAAPEVDGYTFDGWYNGRIKYGADGNDTIEMPAGDVKLTGTYSPKEYTITFNTDGAGTVDPAKYNCDETVETLPEVSKEGYTFLGWYEGDTKVEAPFTMPARDMNLKAEWKEIIIPEYTITYIDGGEIINTATYKENDPIADYTLSNVEGKTFKGWNPELPDVMPAENLTVEAVWETNKHSVTYNAGEGVFENGENKEVFENVQYGAEIPVPEKNPSREGYEFVKWTPTAPEAMPDTELAFTAEWKEIPKPEAQTYEIYVSYPNPANPEETIEKVVITDSALPGTTVEVIKAGEDKTADKAHTYEEIIAKVEANGVEPDYDNRPATVTIGENNKIVVSFKLTEYTATFDADGGVIYDENDEAKEVVILKGYYGQPIEIPGDDRLYRKGYSFAGWDKDVPATFTENTVIKATWEKEIYDAYFYLVDENGEEILFKTESFEFGDEITAPEYTPDEGYVFSGWDVAGETMPDHDVEFRATLTPIGYKLSYVLIGLPEDKGVEAPAEQTGLKAGKDAEVAAAPVVPGYDFNGFWVDADGVDYIADGTDKINMPASDVVLYATYTAKEYTISYITNGADAVPNDTYKCDEKVEALPEVSKEGYTFLGWYEGETEVEAPFTMPARDIVLNAKWEEAVVTKYSIITLDANGGKFSNGAPVYPVKAEVGVPFNAVPADPTREGFEFIGWTDENGDATSIPEVFPENDVTIKAAWAEIYDVTYYDEDGTTVLKSFVDAGMEGENIPVFNAPEKEGYRFIGWEGMPEDGKIPAGDLKLVAKYEEIIIPKYTITYISNGVTVNTASYEANAEIEEYNLSDVEGYTFKGWNPELPDVMPAEDITVNAVWETNKHDITLDANGGTFEDGTPVFIETDVEYGTELSGIIPATPNAPEGYEFAGWDAELPSTMPDSDISLKAQWKLKEYTITYDSKGGSEVPAQTYKFGEEVIAPENPTREGFEFVKWTPDLPETMPANNITVEAVWEAVVVTKTLTIDANGGAFEDGSIVKTETLAVGEEIKNLPVPSREGYDFAGWEGIPENGKMPETDITITATWTPVVIPEHKVEYFYAVDGALYDTLTFKEGEAIVHPAGPAVEGLTFKGWTDENGDALPEVMGSEDLKAYAQFDVNKYKVTYIVDGAVYEEYEVAYQAEVPVPTDPADSATRLFAGWQPNVEDVMPAHDLTYTATWVAAPEPDEYTATFLRHDGETHAKYVLEEGDIIPIPAAPERFGYVFVGWEPEVPDTMPGQDMVFKPKYEIDKTFVTIAIGGGVVIAGGVIAGSIIGANAAAITGVSIVGGILVIVGVAELIKHTHTVTYIVDGEVYKTYKVVEGTRIPVPADPVKDGFTFEGWNPEVPKKMGNEDLVFEATWSEKAVDDSSPEVDVPVPDTGSVASGLTAFAVISGAAAAAYVITRKKKED